MSKWYIVHAETLEANNVPPPPFPPPEIIDAMVERGARALWVESDAMPWAAHKDTITGRSYRAIARASILAALEIEG